MSGSIATQTPLYIRKSMPREKRDRTRIVRFVRPVVYAPTAPRTRRIRYR